MIWNTKTPYFILVLIIAAFIFMPSFADSAGIVPCGGPGEPDCEVCHFFVMAKNIIDFIVLKFVPPVAVLLFAIAGIALYTSGGSQSRVTWARKTLIGIVIGLFVVYGAWMLIDSSLLMVSNNFTRQPSGFPWPWNEIQCRAPRTIPSDIVESDNVNDKSNGAGSSIDQEKDVSRGTSDDAVAGGIQGDGIKGGTSETATEKILPEDIEELRLIDAKTTEQSLSGSVPGEQRQLQLLAKLKNGTTQDLTFDQAVEFVSSDNSVVSINKNGVATLIGEGEAEILAFLNTSGASKESTAMLNNASNNLFASIFDSIKGYFTGNEDVYKTAGKIFKEDPRVSKGIVAYDYVKEAYGNGTILEDSFKKVNFLWDESGGLLGVDTIYKQGIDALRKVGVGSYGETISSPTIWINNQEGNQGSSFWLSGKGFAKNNTATVFLDGKEITTARTFSAGEFGVSFSSNVLGQYKQIWARDNRTGRLSNPLTLNINESNSQKLDREIGEVRDRISGNLSNIMRYDNVFSKDLYNGISNNYYNVLRGDLSGQIMGQIQNQISGIQSSMRGNDSISAQVENEISQFIGNINNDIQDGFKISDITKMINNNTPVKLRNSSQIYIYNNNFLQPISSIAFRDSGYDFTNILSATGDYLNKVPVGSPISSNVDGKKKTSASMLVNNSFDNRGNDSVCERITGNGSRGILLVPLNNHPMCGQSWQDSDMDNSKGALIDGVPTVSSSEWVITTSDLARPVDPFNGNNFTYYRYNKPVMGEPFALCPSLPISQVAYVTKCSHSTFRGYAKFDQNRVFLAADNSYVVLAHELGHSFGGLYDEYVEEGRSPIPSPYLNRLGLSNCVPLEQDYEGCPITWEMEIGSNSCYEGCNYQAKGYFRDHAQDIMALQEYSDLAGPGIGYIDFFGPVDEFILKGKINGNF